MRLFLVPFCGRIAAVPNTPQRYTFFNSRTFFDNFFSIKTKRDAVLLGYTAPPSRKGMVLRWMGTQTISQPPHHARHPRLEERQQEEDDGVAEGVAHAVVEELHPRFGPEEFRRHVQRTVREPEDEPREREPACELGNGSL